MRIVKINMYLLGLVILIFFVAYSVTEAGTTKEFDNCRKIFDKFVGDDHVFQIGSGKGSQVSLRDTEVFVDDAVVKIVPDDWQISINDEIKKNTVSLNISNKNWPDALQYLDDYKFVINWHESYVCVDKIDNQRISKSKNKNEVAQAKMRTSESQKDMGRSKDYKKNGEKEVRPKGTLKSGKFEEEVEKYFNKYGYEVVIKKRFDQELWLSSSIHLPGTGLKEDLEALNRSVQQIPRYKFEFAVYNKNKYVVIIIREV